MLDGPQIVKTEAHLATTIRLVIRRGEIRNAMGPGIAELMATIAGQGIPPECGAWITAQGHTPAPDLWKCYLAGPESNPDPATWRTEFNRPLRR